MFENNDDNVHSQYELLNILDAKAAALLTFNAIALASISIWLGYVPLNYLHLCLDLIFIVMLVSSTFLLRIIWLRWASGTDDEASLDGVRHRRTKHYRLAWKLSTGSIIFLIAVSVVHTAGTALNATGLCGSTCQKFYSDQVFGNLDYPAESTPR